MKAFSIREALEFGWHKTRQHSGLLFQAMLTIFAVEVVSGIVSRTLGGTLAGGSLASLVLAIISVVLSAGLTVITLRLAEGKPAQYADILPPARVVWPYFAASLVAAILSAIGLVLLIVPGIFLIVRFCMVRYDAVEHREVWGSVVRSWRQTRGHWWKLLGFLLILIVINIIGALLFLVGLLVSVPVSMIAWAHVYHTLKARA